MEIVNKDFNAFFIELASNNHKDWFDQNRNRYLNSVKIPFENLIQSVIEAIQKVDPRFKVDAKRSIFRINRDIRFSKDKTPYKLNRSAILSPYGKKDNRPGLYLQIGPEKVMIGGGVYSPEKEELMKIREYIAQNPKSFKKVANDTNFKKAYGSIMGAENKRLPNNSLTKAADKEPIIFKKQFYYMAEFPPERVTHPDLVALIVDHWKAAKPVSDFFEKAMN